MPGGLSTAYSGGLPVPGTPEPESVDRHGAQSGPTLVPPASLAGIRCDGPRRCDWSRLRRAGGRSARLDRRPLHEALADDHRAAGADVDHLGRGIGRRWSRDRAALQQDTRLLRLVELPGRDGGAHDGQPHPAGRGSEHGRRPGRRAAGPADARFPGRPPARRRPGELHPGDGGRRHAGGHLLLHRLRRLDRDAARQDPHDPDGHLRRALPRDDGAHVGHHKVPPHRRLRAHREHGGNHRLRRVPAARALRDDDLLRRFDPFPRHAPTAPHLHRTDQAADPFREYAGAAPDRVLDQLVGRHASRYDEGRRGESRRLEQDHLVRASDGRDRQHGRYRSLRVRGGALHRPGARVRPLARHAGGRRPHRAGRFDRGGRGALRGPRDHLHRARPDRSGGAGGERDRRLDACDRPAARHVPHGGQRVRRLMRRGDHCPLGG